MTTLNANGRSERKSLAGQLDRLDRILDGLADGLNEAVSTAVKEAVVVAVEATVRELLASAELQRRLRPQPAGHPGLIRRATAALGHGLLRAGRCCWKRVTAAIVWGRQTATQAVAALREGGQVVGGRARRGLMRLARRLWVAGFAAAGLVGRSRKALLAALASGLVVGLGCYLAGPAVASAVSGVAGFAAPLAACALGRLRRMHHRPESRQ